MSSSNTIEKEIAQTEELVVATTTQLDASIEKFIEQLPSITKAWMEKEIARAIQEHADRVNNMGIEGVRVLKAELSDFYSQLPDLCKRATANKNAWPHKRSSGVSSLSPPANNDTYFGGAFRSVIEQLGSLLSKYKLIDANQGRSARWERVNGNQYKFLADSGFVDRNLPALVEYEDLHSQRKVLEMRLRSKRDELQKVLAQALWDGT